MTRFGRRPSSAWALGAFAVAVVSATPPSPARAATAYSACMAHAQTTLAMVACGNAGLAEAQQRLDAEVAKVSAALPADRATKLKAAEAQWTTFRTSDCRVFYGSGTGSLAAVDAGSCMIARTEQRIKDVAGFLPERH